MPTDRSQISNFKFQISNFKFWNLRDWPLLALQIAWLAATRLLQTPVLIDDAYIHFRNALNWTQGRGLVYNAGESVLATTSPVYALILGALYKLTGIDFPPLANGFNFTCEVGVMLLTLALLRRSGVPLLFRHVIVAITSFEIWRMVYSRSGMEMSLFLLVILAILLLVLSALSRDRGRPRPLFPGTADGLVRNPQSAIRNPQSTRPTWASALPAGLLLGLIGWIRPEGAVVWLALALALIFLRRWRVLLATYGVAGALAAAIAGLLLYKYGTFMPQSVHAKALAPWFWGANGYPPQQFAITLGDLTPFCLLTGFRSAWGRVPDIINSFAVMAGQLAFMGFGAGWLWRHGRRFLSLFTTLFFFGFYLFHAILATCIFDWYFVPYYFFSQLLAGLGWWAIVRAVWRRLGRRRPALGRAFYRLAALALAVLYFSSSAWMGLTAHRLEGPTLARALRFRFPPTEPGARELEYIKIARTFNALVPPGDPAQVGCMEIGIFGYYFRGRVLDAFGLVSPEALEILKPAVRATLPPGCRHFPYDVFMRFKPKYIMACMIFMYDQPPEFLEIYEEIPRDNSDDGLWCYRLKPGK